MSDFLPALEFGKEVFRPVLSQALFAGWDETRLSQEIQTVALQYLRAQGVGPRLCFAVEHTGCLITEAGAPTTRPEWLDAWRKALALYDSRHVHGGSDAG